MILAGFGGNYLGLVCKSGSMLTRHHLLKEAWPGHRNEPIGGHTKHPATAPAWAAAAVGVDPEVLPPAVIVGTLGVPGSSCSSKIFSIRINVMALPAHVA